MQYDDVDVLSVHSEITKICNEPNFSDSFVDFKLYFEVNIVGVQIRDCARLLMIHM